MLFTIASNFSAVVKIRVNCVIQNLKACLVHQSLKTPSSFDFFFSLWRNALQTAIKLTSHKTKKGKVLLWGLSLVIMPFDLSYEFRKCSNGSEIRSRKSKGQIETMCIQTINNTKLECCLEVLISFSFHSYLFVLMWNLKEVWRLSLRWASLLVVIKNPCVFTSQRPPFKKHNHSGLGCEVLLNMCHSWA